MRKLERTIDIKQGDGHCYRPGSRNSRAVSKILTNGGRYDLIRTEPRRSSRYLNHRETVADAQRRLGCDTPPCEFRQSRSH